MHCPECGAKIADGVSLCPQCGEVVEVQSTQNPQSEQAGEEDAGEGSERRGLLQSTLLWGIGFVVLLVLAIGGAVYLGVYYGERDREKQRQQKAEQYYQDGLKYLGEGEYELAIAAFEYALKLDSGHPLAQQGIEEVKATQTAIAARPTPTVEDDETSLADDLYEQAVAEYEDEQWQEAATTLTQLRQLDPEYKPEKVEEMLFESRYNAGMALLEEDQFERGIFYLDRAVALRPLDEEAATQRRLAMKYMKAWDYWGVDWERCIQQFEELYAIAPNYKDVFQRLYRAHLNYANAWYKQGEMCPAEEQYAKAMRMVSDPGAKVRQKQDEATEICSNATPTPIATVEGTAAITMTELPAGFSVGRLAYPAYDMRTGLYDISALFVDGRLVKIAAGADQPCWVWGTGALGYRDLTSGGLSLWTPGEEAPQRLATGAGLAWPTFSPDGSRMAYAAQDAGGTWHVYLAPTDGSTEPSRHAQGRGPVWGPTGLLAWTGCGEDGKCGIFVDNPDDEQDPVRISGSANDIALNWSPDGGNLAYMSNHTGNWEVYLAGIEGGFVQLTDNPASDGLPAWAPDGSAIAFVSNRDGTWGLYVMQTNGDNPQKLLTLGPSLPNWTAQRISWAP